jgi:hypothetical protein
VSQRISDTMIDSSRHDDCVLVYRCLLWQLNRQPVIKVHRRYRFAVVCLVANKQAFILEQQGETMTIRRELTSELASVPVADNPLLAELRTSRKRKSEVAL